MRTRGSRCVAALLVGPIGCSPPAPGPVAGAGATPPALARTAVAAPTDASLRGVSAVGDRIVWASGTGGTWLRTVDGGRTWRHGAVPGGEALDFRDVQAFDGETALLLSAGAPGRVYRTEDGGRSWQLAHDDDRPEIFFDGMAFWDERRGLAFGDPIDGRVVVIVTDDGGRTWAPAGAPPAALVGEAGFAASGTGIALGANGRAWIGLGGDTGRSGARALRSDDFGHTWSAVLTPLATGASSGIFSLVVPDGRSGIAVGGDYRRPDRVESVAARTDDGGATWSLVEAAPPRGYRSAVAVVPGSGGQLMVTVGPNGSDVSVDGGRRWTALDDVGHHAITFASPRVGWAVGGEGRVSRLSVAP